MEIPAGWGGGGNKSQKCNTESMGLITGISRGVAGQNKKPSVGGQPRKKLKYFVLHYCDA